MDRAGSAAVVEIAHLDAVTGDSDRDIHPANLDGAGGPLTPRASGSVPKDPQVTDQGEVTAWV